MTKRPPLYLIQGGLTQRDGIYRLRKPGAVEIPAESWPKDGEWRKLIESLMRNPRKGE